MTIFTALWLWLRGLLSPSSNATNATPTATATSSSPTSPPTPTEYQIMEIHTCLPAEGLQYNRNRYYDQYTGRWMTHDPLGITPNPQWPNRFEPLGQFKGGANMYEYVGSNPIAGVDAWGLATEQVVKEAMYSYARNVLIRKKHWRKLLKAWYYETGPNPVLHGPSQPTVRDIKANAGFRLLSHCWVAKYIGCLEAIPESGKHFKLRKKYFFWHYYFPDPTVPGGLAAYEDATDFLGSYTAFVKAKKTAGHKCLVDLNVTVANKTSWESACRTLDFFTDMFPSYPSHNRGAGPFTPSTGGDFYQRYTFTVKRIPVIPTTTGTMSRCMALK